MTISRRARILDTPVKRQYQPWHSPNPMWRVLTDWLVDRPGLWYTVETIGDEWGLTTRQVHPAIKAAIRKGLVMYRWNEQEQGYEYRARKRSWPTT